MKYKTYIIAEVGPNHNGSLDMAISYIDELSKIGVNAVKFQLTNPYKLFSNNSFMADYQIQNQKQETPIKMALRHQLKPRDHLKLIKRCKQKKVDYLCTAFDLSSQKFLLNNANLKYIKIASGELFSLDILNLISKSKIPILLSTGMSKFNELQKTINILNSNFPKKIILLHCISRYPAPFKQVNLNVMLKLKKKFKCDVGFSDHTENNMSSTLAVAMGAKFIEKHVTFDKNLEGPDHKASSTITEFKDLVQQIRLVEKIKGNDKNIIGKEEKKISNVARKSIVAKKDLNKNHLITNKDLTFKRPGTGILPIFLDKVVGKRTIKKINRNDIIKLKDLK